MYFLPRYEVFVVEFLMLYDFYPGADGRTQTALVEASYVN